jgi:hypothetical protein
MPVVGANPAWVSKGSPEIPLLAVDGDVTSRP